MVTLDAIRGPVAQELEEFDAFVRRNFKVENELLSGMVDYILSSRGKGVRPLLVLLSAALNAPAGGRGIGQRTYLAAMLVEIIHTASLIHDDVIDEADTRRGETLDALQYLTSLRINKGQDHYTRVTLDTENYRAKREDTLIRLANRMANRAVKTGRKVSLEPMNPYERRVIHSALQPNELVDTHSEGEEPKRHIVITLRK